MPQHTAPPGSFPVLNAASKSLNTIVKKKAQQVKYNEMDSNLGLKAQMMAKFKGYLQRKQKKAITTEPSIRRRFWKGKEKIDRVSVQQQTNTIGSLLTVSVPVTISSTTHYHGNDGHTTTTTTSIVQQLIVLPPLQMYGFMLLLALLLLTVAFAILQIHRTLSMLQLAVDGLKYVLVAFTSNSISTFSFLKSWF